MSALRIVAGTLRVARQAATRCYRSAYFVPCAALVALAAINVLAFRDSAVVRAVWSPLATSPGAAANGAAHAPRTEYGSSTRDAQPAPRLEFSTRKLDLGDGKPKEILRGELTLANRSRERAKFSLVKYCGCTELSPLFGELAPGATQQIHVGLRLPEHANSEKNTSIEVTTGEPAAIVARCVVSARCLGPFEVAPVFISFGSVTPDSAVEVAQEIEVASVKGQPPIDADKLLVEHLDDAFQVERVARNSPANHARPNLVLRVTLKPGLPPSDHWDTLELRLRDSEHVVRVPLNATITEAVTVVPSTVALRMDDEQTFRSVELFVICRAHRAGIDEVSLAQGPPGVRIDDLGATSPGRRRIRLSVSGDSRSLPAKSDIWLRSKGSDARFGFKVIKHSS